MSIARPQPAHEYANSPGKELRKQRSTTNSLTRDNPADHDSESPSNHSSTLSRASRRGARRKKPRVIKQDFDAIKNAYARNAQLFEGMNFSDERYGWGRVAGEFVL